MHASSLCVCCSFHVGSGAQSSSAYANALALAKEVFVNAVSLVYDGIGCHML